MRSMHRLGLAQCSVTVPTLMAARRKAAYKVVEIDSAERGSTPGLDYCKSPSPSVLLVDDMSIPLHQRWFCAEEPLGMVMATLLI